PRGASTMRFRSTFARWTAAIAFAPLCLPISSAAQDTRHTPTYEHIKAALDAVPAIDTHDHLWPFDRLPGFVETEHGRGMNLAGLWRNSYYPGFNPLAPWPSG